MIDRPPVIDLARLREDQAPLAGGKAASLGALLAAGFAVPPGFVVTTEAFAAFAHDNGLDDALRKAEDLAAAGALSPSAPNADLAALRGEIERAVIGPTIAGPVIDSYRALGHARVAVRSSGVREDLPGASFAGQYETALDVEGDDAVLAALRRCWASAWQDRVLLYAARTGGAIRGHGMAVVIQAMVPADVSGVMFTVNPLTGHEYEGLVEAIFGLGEKLVSGKINADRYVVEMETGALLWSKLEGKKPTLETPELAGLAEMGAAIQEHYGRPMDVEWVLANAKLHPVQARPITSITFADDAGEWTTADFKDGGVSASVCAPFMWSLYESALETSMPRYFQEIKLLPASYRTKWGRMFFGRPYWNLGEVKKVLERIPGYNERSFDTDLGIAIPYDGPGKTTKVTLLGILRALPVLFALKRSYRGTLAKNAAYAKDFAWRKAPFDIAAPAVAALDDAAFLPRYRELVTGFYLETEMSYFTTIYNTSNSKLDFKVTFEKTRAACGGSLDYLALVGGLENLSHLRPMKELHAVAARLAAERRPPDDATVLALAQRFKHRGRRELDIRVPRWGDDLPFVREMIERAAATFDPAHDPEAAAAAQHRRYEAERAKAIGALSLRPFTRRAFGKGLALVRTYAWWREEMRDFSSYLYYLVRLWTLDAARRLTAAGHLEAEDDVWYLPFQDVLGALDGKLPSAEIKRKARAGRRMAMSFRSFENPSEIRGRSSSQAAAPPDAARNVLAGTGCSPGVAEGPARVLRGLEEMHRLQKGDVLVAVFTDPGWTPLFSVASAVVTETGGLLSHAALVSREYGIPAVLAVGSATTHIRDGQKIRVDGRAGTVAILDPLVPGAAG
ncbi:MAG: PEP/pyruvate-binding domain-containing protein [Acidobacteriota bacterium]